MFYPIFIVFTIFFDQVTASTICFECFANSTDAGKFCSIDKLCSGTSCYFEYRTNGSWEAGCSSELASSDNITCSSQSSSYSCSCNTDFCNSFKNAQSALTEVVTTTKKSWFIFSKSTKTEQTVSLTLPNRSMVYCEECGSVTVDGKTINIPCDHDHTCQGNYCVSIRGENPYSYCGGVWDEEKDAACYFVDDEPEKCVCSNHMCNVLLEPATTVTTTAAYNDPTIEPIQLIENEEISTENTPPTNVQTSTVQVIGVKKSQETLTVPTTQKSVTKKKCKNTKFSPNDRAVRMGEKLKDVLFGGFGNGAVDDLENDINDEICNSSEDD